MQKQTKLHTFFEKRGKDDSEEEDSVGASSSKRAHIEHSEYVKSTKTPSKSKDEHVFLDETDSSHITDSSSDNESDKSDEDLSVATSLSSGPHTSTDVSGVPGSTKAKPVILGPPRAPPDAPGPTDISRGRTEGPTQPKLSAFPSRQIGKKHRSFLVKWYSSHSWLEYSISKDAAYCFCCRLFPVPGKQELETTFMTSGYRQWKKATAKGAGFFQHERSDYHKTAFCAWKDFQIHAEAKKSIDTELTSAHEKFIKENRHYVKKVGKVLCLTARQKIAQRGHLEGSESSNRGNFLEILELLSEDDDIIKSRLKGTRHVKYTSPEIQNEMLQILANIIRDDISREVQSGVDYSVMVDESKDISGKEQLSVVVRYFFDNNIHEEFLGFCRLHELNAVYLKDKLIQVLTSCSIDLKSCVAQTYDGASVMSGVNQGVQTLFREECAPNAVYIHCYNHRLNLVIVDSVKAVRVADRFFSLLEELYVFMSSHTPHEIYLKKQQEMSKGIKSQQPRKLKKLSNTRWSCQYLSCKVLLDTLPAVIESLKEISEKHSGKRAHDASSLLKNLDYSMIVCLVMFTHILHKTKLLSDMLQSPSLDLSAAADMIQTVQDELLGERNENTWHAIWVNAEEMAQQVGVESKTTPAKRVSKVPCHLQESLVLETVGKRDRSSNNQECDYCVTLYYPVMDRMLAELGKRFDDSNKELLKAISALDPCTSRFLDVKVLRPMAEQYSVELSFLDVEMQQANRLIKNKTNEGTTVKSLLDLATFMRPYKDAFPDLCRLINIALVLPPTSASCERSFSSMRLIKSYLRSTMCDNRLSSLAMLGIHPQRAKDIDMDNFVSLFAQKHNNKHLKLF